MQAYDYTDEVIDRLDDYAWSIPPSYPVNYVLLLQEVDVPAGYLPIKISQYFRCDPATRKPMHYHWAIFIPTSRIPGVGHHYELVGDSPPYHVRSTINNHNARQGMERGSHTVGYVLPTMLPLLEAHFALVPVENLKPSWNCQNWVCDALKRLKHPMMFAIGITLENLVIQMAVVSAAWEVANTKSTSAKPSAPEN